MKSTYTLLISILALAATGGLALVGALLVTSPVPRAPTSGQAIVGKAVRTGTPAIGGPFTLVSTKGESVTDQSFRGKWLLIFFGYTFCPDLCPTALANVSVALEKFGTDTSRLQPLFITVDPQRDTRDVMADYLQSFDPRILGLTGTQAQIDSVTKEYRVYVALDKTERSGNDYLVSHSAYLYLMDPQGKFVNVIEGNEGGDAIAAWLRKEMSGSVRGWRFE
ncbi:MULTISPECIES: SCO family protein [unclassified Bradyrhizobium]|jgi:cytochrome oxidase Cu insertion factor (SCO1/SenC/PrrC family)|uniref:SCO family protein n=1 Tax=unclassified Bradyrhizobium TaxID=2631580 RepID=UPI00070EBD2B|nr:MULTISPECIES: SCO family protein [unclassified Bradyrhizobium]KQT20764.1 electron transporter SenC [Bradyrhizobium sp. Leaf396]